MYQDKQCPKRNPLTTSCQKEKKKKKEKIPVSLHEDGSK